MRRWLNVTGLVRMQLAGNSNYSEKILSARLLEWRETRISTTSENNRSPVYTFRCYRTIQLPSIFLCARRVIRKRWFRRCKIRCGNLILIYCFSRFRRSTNDSIERFGPPAPAQVFLRRLGRWPWYLQALDFTA